MYFTFIDDFFPSSAEGKRFMPMLDSSSTLSFIITQLTHKSRKYVCVRRLHSSDSMCTSIFFAKLSTIIYLTNQTMIPESGITRRRQSKNVHRLPFFLSRPHIIRAIFLFAPYPTWEPVHRLRRTKRQYWARHAIGMCDEPEERLNRRLSTLYTTINFSRLVQRRVQPGESLQTTLLPRLRSPLETRWPHIWRQLRPNTSDT